MSSLFSRLSAMILMLAFAGVTACSAHPPPLNALLVLTTSRKNNNLGSLLFAQAKLQCPKQKGF